MADAELTNDSEFDSRSVYILLDMAVRCPRKHQYVINEVIRILGKAGSGVKGLKMTLEFYKSLNPTMVLPLERRLYACGVLSEEDMIKPNISSLLYKILFKVVTTSSTDCAEYCVNIWLQRVESQCKESLNESIKQELPNPLNFLSKDDLTQPDSTMLVSFISLTTEQRHMLLLECADLLKSVSSKFYVRIIMGLYVFLDLYKSQLNIDDSCCAPELEIWTDTWLHALVSSLLGKFKITQQTTLLQPQPGNSNLSVHHILCGLMVATNSIKLLKSYPSSCRKVLKRLEKLLMFSSGLTSAWLKMIKLDFES